MEGVVYPPDLNRRLSEMAQADGVPHPLEELTKCLAYSKLELKNGV